MNQWRALAYHFERKLKPIVYRLHFRIEDQPRDVVARSATEALVLAKVYTAKGFELERVEHLMRGQDVTLEQLSELAASATDGTGS